MISFEAALKIVLGSSFPMNREKIPFTSSLGRVLVSPVKCDMNMPPWHRSAVDGYACRTEDLGKPLKIVELIAAGKMPEQSISPGTCARIMTGAALPDGADHVFMSEDSRLLDDGTVIFTGRNDKSHYSKAGSDVGEGEVVLPAGRRIRPQDIAVMAMAGATGVTVSSKVNIGVISTGNELVEPDHKPQAAQIRNSNAWQLLAQIIRAGAVGRYYGIAPDDEKETTTLLKNAVDENDVVLISGGVSQGDFDFVPAAINALGFKTHFDMVAVQPGKPLTFCTGTDKIIFGLPGNPVSVFVQFEVMVRPLLDKMNGLKEELTPVFMPLGADFSRKRADRLAWIPVTVNKAGEAIPVEYHGSAHITSLPGAWGIIAIPQGQSWIQKGEIVSVRQI